MFMKQVYARQRVVTLQNMKEHFEGIKSKVPHVASDPTALQLRVRRYLADDALLLLDIFGAPVVSSTTLELPVPRRELAHPIPVAISLSSMVTKEKRAQLNQRWRRLATVERKEKQLVLRPEWSLRDKRHNNAHVKEYCANLFAEAPVTAACLQWNIQRVEAAQQPPEAGIALALAQRLELVPLGITGTERFIFVFLDDDQNEQRLNMLRGRWKAELAGGPKKRKGSQISLD